MIAGTYSNQNIDAVFELVRGGYTHLFNLASKKGHWDEVRCTALAAMCLQVREDSSSPWLIAVKNWIQQEQICEGETKGSWGEEIWDTAMCLIALKELDVSSKHSSIEDGLNWIASLYSINGRNNWHDEPWDTSWALMAILRAGKNVSGVNVALAIRWLLSLQDEDGKIISPHYTAYFLLIDHYSNRTNLCDDLRSTLIDARHKCRDFLIKTLVDSDETKLWTGEAWANGQILWALCSTNLFPLQDIELVRKVIHWFELTQGNDGRWSDVEDTSSAILGLVALLKNLLTDNQDFTKTPRTTEKVIEDRLRKAVPVPRLSIKLPLFEKDSDTGYLSIHIRESLAKKLIAVIGFIGVALLGWLANIIEVLQALSK